MVQHWVWSHKRTDRMVRQWARVNPSDAPYGTTYGQTVWYDTGTAGLGELDGPYGTALEQPDEPYGTALGQQDGPYGTAVGAVPPAGRAEGWRARYPRLFRRNRPAERSVSAVSATRCPAPDHAAVLCGDSCSVWCSTLCWWPWPP